MELEEFLNAMKDMFQAYNDKADAILEQLQSKPEPEPEPEPQPEPQPEPEPEPQPEPEPEKKDDDDVSEDELNDAMDVLSN